MFAAVSATRGSCQ